MTAGRQILKDVRDASTQPPDSHAEQGKHSSSSHGACVMALASMLGCESFSDRPRSVSRPTAAFTRGYNDLLDGERRQVTDLEAAGAHAVHAVGRISPAAHAAALTLVDDLIAIGPQHRAASGALAPTPALAAPEQPPVSGR